MSEFPAAALAASGWYFLEQQAGADRVWALARAGFSRRGTDDLRDFLQERRWPMARLFAESTGIPWPAFVDRWRGWLRDLAAVPATAQRLARLPRALINLDLSAEGADAITVRGRFAAPAPGATCTAVHRLESWVDTLPQPEIHDEDPLELGPDQLGFARAIEGDYDRGERVFLAVDCRTPEAPFGIRLFAGRVTVP